MATVRHLGFFPFCVQNGSTTDHYMATSLEQAMAVWWKVKKWRVTTSCTGYNTMGGTDYYWANFTETYDIERNDSVLAEYGTVTVTTGIKPPTVKHLVCDIYQPPVSVLSYNSTGSTTGNWSYGVYTFDVDPYLDPAFIKDTSIYGVNARTWLNPISGEIYLSSRTSDLSAFDTITNVGLFTLSTGTGSPVTIDLKMGTNSFLPYTTTATWNVTVEAIEFYSYT